MPGDGHSLSVGVIFISYALQVKFVPYASSGVTNDLDSVEVVSGMRLVYVRATVPVTVRQWPRPRVSMAEAGTLCIDVAPLARACVCQQSLPRGCARSACSMGGVLP